MHRDTTISYYDDVGSSYQWSTGWNSQLTAMGMGFQQTFAEGSRRLATGQGVTPSKMVWYTDQHMDVMVESFNPSMQLVNGYGDVNRSAVVFLDGSARYVTVLPGHKPGSFRNATYTLIFDDLPNPGH